MSRGPAGRYGPRYGAALRELDLLGMSWSWQLEKEDGTVLGSRGLPKETFSSQGDAETWIGENWQALLDAGVDQVTLMEEGRAEYGPMSLHPAE
jgi:hypothetical protein